MWVKVTRFGSIFAGPTFDGWSFQGVASCDIEACDVVFPDYFLQGQNGGHLREILWPYALNRPAPWRPFEFLRKWFRRKA